MTGAIAVVAEITGREKRSEVEERSDQARRAIRGCAARSVALTAVASASRSTDRVPRPDSRGPDRPQRAGPGPNPCLGGVSGSHRLQEAETRLVPSAEAADAVSACQYAQAARHLRSGRGLHNASPGPRLLRTSQPSAAAAAGCSSRPADSSRRGAAHGFTPASPNMVRHD